MKDCLGRNINYLRVSLTPQCNLRCIYCMPADGCKPAKNTSLSPAELWRLLTLICKTGIRKIRLTGGEPLLYPQLSALVQQLRQLTQLEEIAMTTNGILLAKYAADLKQAGLNSINLSLDCVDAALFAQLTRGGDLNAVLSGIDAAKAAGLTLKLNCVLIKGLNDMQILPLIEFAQAHKLPLRFIELMPLNTASNYLGISEESVKAVITAAYGKMTLLSTANAPAHYYTAAGLSVKIGFISAVSHAFCNSCNRIRLMSNGLLKPCLHYRTGLDLKTLLAKGCSDEEILQAIQSIIYHKPERHHLTEKNFSCQENCSMSLIGG